MKLKIYHSLLLVILFISLAASLSLGIISFIDFFKTPSNVLDNLVLVLCFILLVAFNVLQIVNTLLSFKTGSVFIKSLAFDSKKKLNSPFLFIIFIVSIFAIGFLIYFIIITLNPTNEYILGTTPLLFKNLIISLCVLIISDVIAIELFPILGKEDKSFIDSK